jgi:Bacterial toxin 46/Putative peptidoglycan binding domain
MLLNLRLNPSPALKIDGYFGPKTLQAVRRLQSSSSITADGVVGKSTWSHLFSGPSSRSVLSVNILGWSIEKKCEEAARRVPGKLPHELREQLLGLVSVQSVAVALALFAVSSFFGVGELIGLGMLLVLGEQAVFELAHAIQITALASTEQELDEAADHLAQAFVIAGVAVVSTAIGKYSRGKIAGAEPVDEAPPENDSGLPARRPPTGAGGPKPILWSVTTTELELAASPGNSEAQVTARKSVARAFYSVYTDPEKFSDAKIEQHLKGIDFSKPVKARFSPPPPPPDVTTQWQAPGAPPGKYFGNPGSLPKDMGIGEFGLDSSDPRRVVPKVESQFRIARGTPVLESIASKLKDVWSAPAGKGSPFTIGDQGMIQGTKGGAAQYFVPDENAAVRRN